MFVRWKELLYWGKEERSWIFKSTPVSNKQCPLATASQKWVLSFETEEHFSPAGINGTTHERCMYHLCPAWVPGGQLRNRTSRTIQFNKIPWIQNPPLYRSTQQDLYNYMPWSGRLRLAWSITSWLGLECETTKEWESTKEIHSWYAESGNSKPPLFREPAQCSC